MNALRIIRKILIGIMISYVCWATFTFAENMVFGERKTVCGIVKYKNDKLHAGKYNTTTDYILVVERDGYLYDEEVSYGSFVTKSVGSQYCSVDRSFTFTSFSNMFVGLVGNIVLGFTILFFFVYFLVWVFTGKFPKHWLKS